jgi:hypothetical protein
MSATVAGPFSIRPNRSHTNPRDVTETIAVAAERGEHCSSSPRSPARGCRSFADWLVRTCASTTSPRTDPHLRAVVWYGAVVRRSLAILKPCWTKQKAPQSGPKAESGGRASNPRPQAWEACALPTELPPHASHFRASACLRPPARSLLKRWSPFARERLRADSPRAHRGVALAEAIRRLRTERELAGSVRLRLRCYRSGWRRFRRSRLRGFECRSFEGFVSTVPPRSQDQRVVGVFEQLKARNDADRCGFCARGQSPRPDLLYLASLRFPFKDHFVFRLGPFGVDRCFERRKAHGEPERPDAQQRV